LNKSHISEVTKEHICDKCITEETYKDHVLVPLPKIAKKLLDSFCIEIDKLTSNLTRMKKVDPKKFKLKL